MSTFPGYLFIGLISLGGRGYGKVLIGDTLTLGEGRDHLLIHLFSETRGVDYLT